jgi:hypothetical protein
LLKVTATASAVNEITVANAATGNNPVLSATGSDTNIGITLTPKGTGNVTVSTGNLVIGTANKGIDFSINSSAAGMTSELLDDYEEGTWTPAIAFSGASVDVTYFARSGTYTKIGNTVVAEGRMYVNSKGTSTGNFEFNGFPFTASDYSALSLTIRGGVSYTGMMFAFINILEARVTVDQMTEAGTQSSLTQANVSQPEIIFTCVYTTNA